MSFTVLYRLAAIPRDYSGSARKCPTVEEIEQDAIRNSLSIKQERKKNCVILLYRAFPRFLIGWASTRRGAFIRGERLIQSLHLVGWGRGVFIGYKAFIREWVFI